MIRDFEALMQSAKGKGEKNIAIAAAEDQNTIEALKELKEHIDVNYFLIGDSQKITETCGQVGLNIDAVTVIHTESDEESAAKAVELAAKGEADVLMKGKLGTATLLKAVLNKETGIQLGGLMSHLAVLESPNYHKLMFVSDGGINTTPDLEKKKAILNNAVDFMHKLGYDKPNVAAICAVENVSDKMQETVDAAAIAESNKAGEVTGCHVEGPISFDLAISAESAALKGFESKIAGETDFFLMPNIATGNVMVKAPLYLGGAKMAGCVLGAKVPIVLTSRGATAEEKLLSFLLTLAAS